MIQKGYTTKSQIENYLLTTVNAIFHDQVNEWIAMMETHLDNTTGRNFIADTVVSERVYDGNAENELIIDDTIEITKIEIDDVELDSDEYFIYPANDTPKYVLRMANGGTWPKGNQNITVTAKWGYSVAVPNDIVFACTVLVAGIINYSSKDSQGQVETKSIGRYSVTYKDQKQWQDFDQIDKIIKSYKKFTF